MLLLHLMKSELETVLNESTETNLSPASVAGHGQGGYRSRIHRRHESVVRTPSAAPHLPLATLLGRLAVVAVLTDNVRACRGQQHQRDMALKPH